MTPAEVQADGADALEGIYSCATSRRSSRPSLLHKLRSIRDRVKEQEQ